MEWITLNNGRQIPIIGFGTYFPNVLDTEEAVYQALENGYRHLDCAKWYNNEELVGRAIKRSGVNRKDLFITTKIECSDYDTAIQNVYDSLKKNQVDYFDLVLIHWPEEKYMDTYRALEDLYDQGIIKAIGVSSFNSSLMDELLKQCRIPPVVNQIETHIYFQEKKMNDYLVKHQIVHEAWAPFAEGYLNLFQDPVICELASKYQKSSAQILLRFFIQKNIVVLPKSTNVEHIKENIQIFDFSLEEEDMKRIEELDQKKQYSDWPICMREETIY